MTGNTNDDAIRPGLEGYNPARVKRCTYTRNPDGTLAGMFYRNPHAKGMQRCIGQLAPEMDVCRGHADLMGWRVPGE